MDKKTLHRFFAGTASFEEEEAVCDWADASDKNREELIRERKYFDVLLLHGGKNGRSTRSERRFSLFVIFKESLKIAAAIAVLMASALYIYNYDRTERPDHVSAMNRVVVPPGQRVNLTLSDGTNVWLNACSELLYPASFSEDVRSVSLKGEAYFDVSKDTEHPFIVQTSKCDIKVLGTKFNLQTSESENEFSAALLEGSIELTNKMEPGSAVLLSPMTKAEWKNGVLEIDSILNLDDYRWKEGLICFENILFPDLMNRFEKVYDISIEVRNKNLNTYKCSGKCRMSDGVDFILQVLQRSAQFTFSRSEDNAIIYIN